MMVARLLSTPGVKRRAVAMTGPAWPPGIQTARLKLWEGGCRRLKADQASGTDGDYSLLSDRLDLLLVECGHCPVRLAQHVLETNHTPAS